MLQSEGDRSTPLQPSYIFRGHGSQIQTLHFFRNNSRLLSGDGDGWVVIWNVASRRPAAVWKAHEDAILGACAWQGRIITYALALILAVLMDLHPLTSEPVNLA